MKILVTEGFFATNIGNAFFERGVRYLMRKVLPEGEYYFLGDVSANMWTIKGKPPENDFNYLKYFDVDYLVISGPCLDRRFALWYTDLFDRLFSREKTRLILLSVGGYTYDSDEVEVCRSFLAKYTPFMLFTRDEVAYRCYHDLAEVSYNGIDTAFFISEYHKGISARYLEPYITMNFDHMSEPSVKLKTNEHKEAIDESTVEVDFRSDQSKLIQKLIGLYPTLRRFRSEKEPDRVGPYTIIRPTHRASHRYALELFAKKNTYVSEVPDGYLNLYKYTALNLTDRVHSAIASLVWGNPTRLFTKSKRANLFARVGAESVLQKVTRLDQKRLLEEKEKMILAFRRAFRME